MILNKVRLIGLLFQMMGLAGCALQPASMSSVSVPEEIQPLAFPGAEGFGKYATGGRGGQVVVVTNLADDGPGSLRDAIQKKGARMVVFAVSGNLELASPLDINNGDITIAGQSAPGEGVTIRNYPVSIKADNVIVRYLRFRLGDVKGVEADGLSANKGKNNIIVDHCSISWATDEVASFYRNKNFTLQWSIISESLNQSVHAKGEHGYGGIWGGAGATFHHNLIANHMSRMPRFSGSKSTPNAPDELVDFRNNVIFNWGGNNVYGGERGRYNIVNNYYKPGPATPSSKKERLLEPYAPYGQFYLAGNMIEGNPEITQHNRLGVVSDHPDSILVGNPFSAEPLSSESAQDAFEAVLAHAGASFKRDKVDERIIQEVRSGNATGGKYKNGILDSQEEVGGWPELQSGQVPEDKDQDGMPDAWEQKYKLDPSDAADAAAFTLKKHYTNIEVYLNSLLEQKSLIK